MARTLHLPGWHRASKHLSSPLFPRFLIFLTLCLLMYYILRKQQKLFSELRLPSTVIPPTVIPPRIIPQR
jgi:hypothetical protein